MIVVGCVLCVYVHEFVSCVIFPRLVYFEFLGVVKMRKCSTGRGKAPNFIPLLSIVSVEYSCPSHNYSAALYCTPLLVYLLHRVSGISLELGPSSVEDERWYSNLLHTILQQNSDLLSATEIETLFFESASELPLLK